MKVDAVLILEVRIDKVVRQAGHDGKFISGFRVEIRISSSAIDRHETEAEIGEPVGIVGAAGDISRCVDHRVVDALVPFQRSLPEHVREGCPPVGGTP